MGPGRFELPTSRLSGVRSNQLSYEPVPPTSAAMPDRLASIGSIVGLYRFTWERAIKKPLLFTASGWGPSRRFPYRQLKQELTAYQNSAQNAHDLSHGCLHGTNQPCHYIHLSASRQLFFNFSQEFPRWSLYAPPPGRVRPRNSHNRQSTENATPGATKRRADLKSEIPDLQSPIPRPPPAARCSPAASAGRTTRESLHLGATRPRAYLKSEIMSSRTMIRDPNPQSAIARLPPVGQHAPAVLFPTKLARILQNSCEFSIMDIRKQPAWECNKARNRDP